MDPRQPNEFECTYREVLLPMNGRELTELLYQYRDEPPLRNALVSLIALQSGQTREQVFNALADLYALRCIFGKCHPGE